MMDVLTRGLGVLQTLPCLPQAGLWELAMLIVRGWVRLHGTVEDSVRLFVEATGAEIRAITPEIAALAWQFPDDFSRDPAGRLIAATASDDPPWRCVATRGYGQKPLRRIALRSPSIAPRIFDWTSGNFTGSRVSGVPPPA